MLWACRVRLATNLLKIKLELVIHAFRFLHKRSERAKAPSQLTWSNSKLQNFAHMGITHLENNQCPNRLHTNLGIPKEVHQQKLFFELQSWTSAPAQTISIRMKHKQSQNETQIGEIKDKQTRTSTNNFTCQGACATWKQPLRTRWLQSRFALPLAHRN